MSGHEVAFEGGKFVWNLKNFVTGLAVSGGEKYFE